MSQGALFSLRPVLPEYEPRNATSLHLYRVGSVLGMCTGLSMGRLGWALCVRLIRALAGEMALAPLKLIEKRCSWEEWLRSLQLGAGMGRLHPFFLAPCEETELQVQVDAPVAPGLGARDRWPAALGSPLGEEQWKWTWREQESSKTGARHLPTP